VNPVNLTKERGADSYNPAWSPDGKVILFTGATKSSTLNLFKLNLYDSAVSLISDDPYHDYVNLPGRSWCSKNNRIVISSDRNDNDDIWTLNPDGTDWRQVTKDASKDWEPSWSDDCEWIVFQSKRNNNWDIYKIRPDGSGLERLTYDAADDWEPNWSPDGRWIVFQSKRNGVWQLYVVRPDGTGITQLTQGTAQATDPSWTPDGKSVVYSADAEPSQSEDIFMIDIATLEARNLTNHAGYEGAPSISPDGRFLAFEADWDGRMDIWLVEMPK